VRKKAGLKRCAIEDDNDVFFRAIDFFFRCIKLNVTTSEDFELKKLREAK
ncbi:unnamed protein product, partial [Heterotrigona itama]